MCHVLIIEDETLIALDIEDILLRQGATSFDVVATEADAVCAALLRRPDFITADLVLKTGLGSTAVETITERYGDIPTLFISATPEVCHAGQTTRVLRKPVNESAVCKAYHALRSAA